MRLPCTVRLTVLSLLDAVSLDKHALGNVVRRRLKVLQKSRADTEDTMIFQSTITFDTQFEQK